MIISDIYFVVFRSPESRLVNFYFKGINLLLTHRHEDGALVYMFFIIHCLHYEAYYIWLGSSLIFKYLESF